MTWSSPLRKTLAAAGLLIATSGPALAEIPIATAGPMTGSLAGFGDSSVTAPNWRSATSMPAAVSSGKSWSSRSRTTSVIPNRRWP